MSFGAPQLDYLVESFHPGYMDSPEPDSLPKGATPDAKNCLFDGLQLKPPRATLKKREGSRLLTPAAVVAGKGFDGLFEFRKVGQTSGRIVAVIDGKVWYWDNISAFVQIGVTAPFAPGTKATFHVERNLLFIMDGTTTRCWDGVLVSDLFTPGQVAPTSAPVLTDGGVFGGSGITGGTYEDYAVWYDSTHDHESSPSALSAQVVLIAGHQRTHAKPAGAPGANYDKWRVYTRRVDTNETYFWRVAEAAIAAPNISEALSDGARRLTTIGPLPLQNDPPPLTFRLQAEYQGYRLGVIDNDDQIYVSKLGDPQSQHPTDILGVSRGSGGELRSIFKFGTECVVQKAAKTYRLKGDRMPFIPDEIHSTFGNVGPSSAVEVKGKFFGWDEEQGPYWTDLNLNWQPIGTARVQDTINAVPKTFADGIECVYLKALDLVLWSIPNNVSGRRRTLLAYHVEFDSWLPPITGLEYACLVTFVNTNGSTNLYVGDYWGRLFQYFTDFVEGVPSGTLVARVLAGSAGTVTCDFEQAQDLAGDWQTTATAAAFYTTGAGLAGLPVLHVTAGGQHQWRRIQSNTGNVLTLDTTNDAAWNSIPVAGDQIVVGGLDWYWRSPIITFGDPFRKKKGHYVAVQAKPGSNLFRLALAGLMEGLRTVGFTRSFSLANSSGWGKGAWGSMKWGGGDADAAKTRLMRTFFGFAFEIANPYPNQPVSILQARVAADPLGYTLVKSGGSS